MAAIRYRVNEVKADRIVYVTDVGQELHFKQLFEAGEKVGFVDPKKTKLDHMMFGMVLQESITTVDGKEVKKLEKIKTRAGKSVKLAELLDEARDRALQSFEDRASQKTEEAKGDAPAKVQIEGKEQMAKAAEILGMSSVKYYDLK